MATRLLTVKEVAAIKSDGRHSLGDGLYLEIVGKARRWFTRYTFKGVRRELVIGSANDLGLRDARLRVAEIRGQVKAGLDPIAEKRAAEIETAKTPTFGEFADELVASLETGFRNEKHIYQWRQTLGEAYCGLIRDKAIDEIDTDDVLRVLKPHWAEKQETASRLRGRIEKVLDAAKAKGWRSGENPARWKGHLDHLLSRRQKLQRGHQPALSYELVPAFVQRLRAREAIAARALEFLILTASRSGEVTGAIWSEFDLKAAVWTIPGDRMKAGREHRVPLSPRAIALLKEAQAVREDASADAVVFPSVRKGLALSNMAFRQLLDRMGETGFVPHGFRSSFRDWCGECTSHPREVAEAALAHIIGNSVEQAYRRGDALEKRRKLMDEWAEYIEGV